MSGFGPGDQLVSTNRTLRYGYDLLLIKYVPKLNSVSIHLIAHGQSPRKKAVVSGCQPDPRRTGMAT